MRCVATLPSRAGGPGGSIGGGHGQQRGREGAAARNAGSTTGGDSVTQIRVPQMTDRDDVELLLSDLASVCGALDEIATMWRRARLDQPQLPVALPAQLQSFATRLAAAIRADASQGPAQATGQAPSLPEQLCALKQRIDVAQAITCGHGRLQAGDDRLWESVNAALAQAIGHAHQAGPTSA
jgi:hypothetical protein